MSHGYGSRTASTVRSPGKASYSHSRAAAANLQVGLSPALTIGCLRPDAADAEALSPCGRVRLSAGNMPGKVALLTYLWVAERALGGGPFPA